MCAHLGSAPGGRQVHCSASPSAAGTSAPARSRPGPARQVHRCSTEPGAAAPRPPHRTPGTPSRPPRPLPHPRAPASRTSARSTRPPQNPHMTRSTRTRLPIPAGVHCLLRPLPGHADMTDSRVTPPRRVTALARDEVLLAAGSPGRHRPGLSASLPAIGVRARLRSPASSAPTVRSWRRSSVPTTTRRVRFHDRGAGPRGVRRRRRSHPRSPAIGPVDGRVRYWPGRAVPAHTTSSGVTRRRGISADRRSRQRPGPAVAARHRQRGGLR
jgi:hypothetical protein